MIQPLSYSSLCPIILLWIALPCEEPFRPALIPLPLDVDGEFDLMHITHVGRARGGVCFLEREAVPIWLLCVYTAEDRVTDSVEKCY